MSGQDDPRIPKHKKEIRHTHAECPKRAKLVDDLLAGRVPALAGQEARLGKKRRYRRIPNLPPLEDDPA
jgi:hypothetical protein